MKIKKRFLANFFVSVLIFFFAHAAIAKDDSNPLRQTLYASPTGVGSSCSAVSPCTLLFARDLSRQSLSRNIAMIVYLKGGIYHLDSPLRLDSRDSGQRGYPTIYTNVPGEHPILSGGKEIKNWELYDAQRNVFRARANGLRFRQLYVDSELAVRARYPNSDNSLTGAPYLKALASNPFTIARDDYIKIAGANLTESEIVWISHWKQKRTRVSSTKEFADGVQIYFKSPERDNNEALNQANQKDSFYYFENSLDFLDVPGEWFLDIKADFLYYKPRAGEAPSELQFIAPTLDELLEIAGNSNDLVHDIEFSGVELNYSNWVDPDYFGYLNPQAAVYLATNKNSLVPGAIRIKNAKRIHIKKNVFRYLGAHAILTAGRLNEIEISGNKLQDIAAGGIYEFSSGNSSNSKIFDNSILNFGKYYTDAVGIFLANPFRALVVGNSISSANYSGISLGWSWDDKDRGVGENRILANDIHDVMRLHDDGGGVYVLGSMLNSCISFNRISNINPSIYTGDFSRAGVYLDNGSTGQTIANNFVDSSVDAFVAKNLPNYGNLFFGNVFEKSIGIISSENKLESNFSGESLSGISKKKKIFDFLKIDKSSLMRNSASDFEKSHNGTDASLLKTSCIQVK